MAILEAHYKWTFTGSTGSGKAFNCRGFAERLTFGIETSSGCTGTVTLQTRMGSSAGPYASLASTAVSSAAFVIQQATGPLEWVKPRLETLTAGSTNTVTVYLMGN